MTDGFPKWKDGLAIPVDTDLPSEVWASSITVMLPIDHDYNKYELKQSLRLLDHYGVNSVVIEASDVPGLIFDDLVETIRTCFDAKEIPALNILIAISSQNNWKHSDLNPWSCDFIRLAVPLDDEDGQRDEEFFNQCLILDVGMVIISGPVTGHNLVFLERLLSRQVPVLLTGSNTDGLYAWLQSVRNGLPKPDPLKAICDSFNNVLQQPLQPLRDNLSSATYDVFEQDPVKYDKYQEAMTLALRELSGKKPGIPLRIGILGAGRGPLVDRLLLALENISLTVGKIHAVDKSPMAYMTLLRRNQLEWSVLYDGKYADIIDVQCTDIRRGGPQSLDLIVTELLGSFGDNELAPECMSKAEGLLAKDGVMIPSSYTSWIEPVCCPQIARKLQRASKLARIPKYSNVCVPYTCRITDASYLSKPAKVFTFRHPSGKNLRLEKENGAKKKDLQFCQGRKFIPFDGFAGYFSAVLYGPVTISTVRGQETPGMYSWFPFYFPYLCYSSWMGMGGNHISLTIRRKWNRFKVWYEWNEVNKRGTCWSIEKHF